MGKIFKFQGAQIRRWLIEVRVKQIYNTLSRRSYMRSHFDLLCALKAALLCAFECVHDRPLIVCSALPWRLYYVLTPLSFERRGLVLKLPQSDHLPSFTRQQIVLKYRAALFGTLSYFSGRSGSASLIVGRCDSRCDKTTCSPG